MDIKKKSYTTGVIIARLQVATLHEAHKELIDTVLKEHPKVMIFLGLSPVRGSIRDPLDFQARKQMILESYPHDKYPNLSIYYIKDNFLDEKTRNCNFVLKDFRKDFMKDFRISWKK